MSCIRFQRAIPRTRRHQPLMKKAVVFECRLMEVSRVLKIRAYAFFRRLYDDTISRNQLA